MLGFDPNDGEAYAFQVRVERMGDALLGSLTVLAHTR
jgi:hypothetical protein